jgi:pimeloyl-ACP methyl ester carboxylesterase
LADFDITENAGEGSVRIGNRSLFYCQVGGPFVLHNQGIFAPHALNLGLRFVCVDRPGQAKSDPQRDRTFAGRAADLEAVANALGADQFAVTVTMTGLNWDYRSIQISCADARFAS